MVGSVVALYNRIVNSLSFGPEYQKLLRLLNTRIDSPESIAEVPASHPGGFIRELKKRRITIVESYLIILRYLESEHHRERINALRLLEEQTFHSKSLTMPLNTARVQLALMKEAIKNRDNKRRQLELLEDFTISAYGQPSAIRGYLDELGIIELPENGLPLAEMRMGWDLHVHDNSSFGRKTPSQLVIDAFIKGISEITVAFSVLSNRAAIEEVLEAGAILGVRVNLGVEFSAVAAERRFHFMFLPPPVRDTRELSEFVERNRETMRWFAEGLAATQRNRLRAVRALVHNFNTAFLPDLNRGYPESSVYYLPPLDLTEVDEIAPLDVLNRLHLGELLYRALKPVLLKRVLLAKSLRQEAANQLLHGEISQWDFNNLSSRYVDLRHSYVELNSESLRATYFSNPDLSDYPTAFEDLESVARRLKGAGGKIKVLHPLEHGLDGAYELLLTAHQFVDFVEIYNMYDSINRSIDDILRFTGFVNALNGGEIEQVRPFLNGHDLSRVERRIPAAARAIGERHLIPVCGSDSTGRSRTIPGMGFIYSDAIIGRHRRRYLDRHFALPELVSRSIEAGGSLRGQETPGGRRVSIVSMGKATKGAPNKVGDEHETTPIPIGRALRYLNAALKSLLYVGVGFLVAYLALGFDYSLLWLGITAIRHVVVDLLAGRGSHVREWHWRAVDYRNMSRSLFWTGLSVPLLALAKGGFDLIWPFPSGDLWHSFAKFFVISFVNGIYLYAHNTLRGFDKNVAKANFFRSIFSWPIASLFGPLGDLIAIPTIVQAKVWSDIVGGLIEGAAKFSRAVRLTRRDLSEIIPLACAAEEEQRNTAILDLLYIFGREPRARNSLQELLFGRTNRLDRVGELLRGKPPRPPVYASAYESLRAWFGHQGNYYRLSDFAISRYDHEWALTLIDLIAREYPRMVQWLKAQDRPGGGAVYSGAARTSGEKSFTSLS